MRGLIRSLLALLLCSAPLGVTQAEPSACGHYRVAFYEFGTLYFKGPANEHTGIDVDVIKALEERSGCQFERVLESRVRIWDQLAKGLLDITVSGVKTPERELHAEFIPYLRARNHALMRKDLAPRYPTAESLLVDTQRRVVVVRGFRHGASLDAWLERMRQQGRVDEVADFETGLRVLSLGRADVMLTHPLNLRGQEPLRRTPMTLIDWAPEDTVQASLVLSRSRIPQPDRDRLRQALGSLLQDGSIDRILRKHLDDKLAASSRLDAASPGSMANTNAGGAKPPPADGR